MRPGILLQARFASTRLPGKALATIRSRSILQHCIDRLLARNDALVILATSTNPEDDALVAVAADRGISCFRGDAEDVLGRYAEAASRFRLDPIVRATADNPAVDMDAPWRVLRALESTGADYVAETGLPVGAAVEGITAAALRRADMAARASYDREHVTTFVKTQTGAFRSVMRPAPPSLHCPELRLTVDTEADLDHVRALFDRVETDQPTLRRLIEAAEPLVHREVA